jgi:N-acetylglucosaminyl-diphospho-decaprenol L-rhamnosyltransferase
MLLSIIIVSWNTKDLLDSCLNSIFDNPFNEEYEVWLVDNASSDGSVEMVKTKYPSIKMIENQNNPGFAGGNNQAIRVSSGKYILLLNPDTEVKPDALNALVSFLEECSQAGAAGARLVSPDGSMQLSCHPDLTLPREMWRLFHLDKLRSYGVYDMHQWDKHVPRQVDVLQGAALLLRKSALDQVGLMDEDYFMYTEEVDLCYRLRKAGWQLWWVPKSEVLHYGGQSTKLVKEKMFLTLYESRLKFFRKHHGSLTATGYKIVLSAAALIRVVLTPLSWILHPSNRERTSTLSSHYRRLLAALPRM